MPTETSLWARVRKHLHSYAAIPFLAVVLVVTGCTAPAESTTSEPASVAEAFLAEHELAGLDTAQIIERLDTMPRDDRPQDLMASIRPDELLLSDAQGREAVLPMPDDQFYLSLAPFRTQTHDCYFHSLTTCTGELQNTDVRVTVTNNQTGQVVIDEAVRTYDNGFLGLWLPRNLDATLTVEADGLSASTPISTATAEDPTCLTTLQLT